MADFVFTSNEGYRARTHTHKDTHIDTRAHKTHTCTSLCATAAPPTQLLSRECTGPSNSERESEQKREILARAGDRGMGKERERERDEREGGAVEH